MSCLVLCYRVAKKDDGNGKGRGSQVTAAKPEHGFDLIGSHKILGKPVLSDLSEGRITLPMIYTLNQNNGALRNRLADLFHEKERDPDAKDKILEIIRSNGALDYTFQQAVKYSRQAQSLLSGLPRSMYRDSLHNIPDYVLYRNR